LKKTATNTKKTSSRTTIDAAEVRQFADLAAHWWDEKGPLGPLHRINPVRLGYIREQICTHFGRNPESFTPFTGLKMADIGCGGGLVTEPLCRMGAMVTGIDAGAENIKTARQHARQQKLDIEYIAGSVEDCAEEGRKFDIVTALEIVEHVADPALFLASCTKLVKKNGLIILSTLNRTPKSFALGIVAAEYILRWVPAGTHDWKKFVKPSELAKPLTSTGLEIKDVTGMIYNPLQRTFALSKDDLGVNYLMTASKP
jgi:2-polyprenyl-6-hydroxyphenyl methylase / 3-demethylubiquinone-9 3-methyltransferase